MKVRVIKDYADERPFEPFKVEITITRKEELEELWHRLNFGPIKYERNWKSELVYPFWELINEVAKKRKFYFKTPVV